MLDKKIFIERLKVLHLQKSGVSLTDAQALKIFEQLICLVAAVYQPMRPMAGSRDRPQMKKNE